MKLFSYLKPMAALKDLGYVVRTPTQHKLGIAGVCAAVTYLLISSLIHAFTPAPVHHAPEIIYVKQWPKSRTLAQIKAQQAIDGPIEAAARAKEAAEEKAEAEHRRAQFEKAHQVLKSIGIN